MATEFNDNVSTEVGDVTIRTLSHHLLVEMPRTTIFSSVDPYDEDTLVSFVWDTLDPSVLQQMHSSLMNCIQKNGFRPLKEAAMLLEREEATKQTAGKVKLLMLLTPEVAAHVVFVG